MAIFDIFRKKQEQPQLQEEQQREQQELTAGLEKTKTGLFLEVGTGRGRPFDGRRRCP